MHARILVALLTLSFSRCVGIRLQATPSVFPLRNVWSTPLDGIIDGELATDGRLLYVSLRDGVVFALAPDSGSIAWRSEGAVGRVTADATAVIARRGDGMLTRFDADGVIRWRTSTRIDGPLPSALDENKVFVVGNGAAAIDLASGRSLWSTSEGEATAPPVLAGTTLLVGERDGTFRARSTAHGRTQWTFATRSPILAAPATDDKGRVFLGSTARRFFALSVTDGRLLWRWRVGADVQEPPAILGKGVVFTSHEAVMYSLNRRNGNMVWRQALPSRPRSGPVMIGTAIVVACRDSDLVGFDGLTGRRLGSLTLPSGFATGPVIVGTRLFVGLRGRGTVVGIDLASGSAERPGQEHASVTALPSPTRLLSLAPE